MSVDNALSAPRILFRHLAVKSISKVVVRGDVRPAGVVTEVAPRSGEPEL